MLRVLSGVASVLLATASAVLPGDWRARELGHSEQAAWDMAQTLVYRDSARFRAAWVQLYPIAASRPALPLVDFTKWRVLIIVAGTKPTGGYSLTLESGRTVHDSALITVTLHTPPRGCGVIEQLTTPAVAIATLNSPAPFRIIFHERADSVHCN